MNSKRKILWKLFLSTLYLSTFTFGGGYVIVTLLKDKFVDQLHWIDEEEMLDLVAIAQSSPGAIAVNGAAVLGYKLAGIVGVTVAVIGAVIPPLVILSVISLGYQAFISNEYIAAVLQGMSSGVGAVIASVVYDMAAGIVREHDPFSNILMAVFFISAYFLQSNVMLIIAAAACIGAARTIRRRKRAK